MKNHKNEKIQEAVESKSRRKINTPLIIALFAVVISFISVLLSYKETSILEEQQKLLFEQQGASVWPYLDNSPDYEINDDTALFKYEVTNKGVGPAIIGNVVYTYKDEEIKSWGLFLKLEENYTDLSINQMQTANLNRIVLAPGESFSVVTIRVTANDNFKGNLIDVLNSISEDYKLQYCYCSVYGDCWQVNGWDNLTKSSDCKIRGDLVY